MSCLLSNRYVYGILGYPLSDTMLVYSVMSISMYETQGGLMTIICYTGSKFSNKTGRVHHPPQIRQFSISKHVVIMLILHKPTLFAMNSTICFTISVTKPVLPCNRYILDTRQVIMHNQSQPLPIGTQMRSKRISDSHSVHITMQVQYLNSQSSSLSNRKACPCHISPS